MSLLVALLLGKRNLEQGGFGPDELMLQDLTDSRPLLGIFAQEFRDEGRDLFGEVRYLLVLVVSNLLVELFWVLGKEGLLQGAKLEEDDAKTPDIGLDGVRLRTIFVHQLWSQIERSTHPSSVLDAPGLVRNVLRTTVKAVV